MQRYSRYSRYRTKSHDKSTKSHDISRYSRYQTVLSKLQEIISTLVETCKKRFCYAEPFCYLLDELRCNELPYGHELAYAMNCTFTFWKKHGIIMLVRYLIDKLEFYVLRAYYHRATIINTIHINV
jgi:hypothetical protein